MTYVTLSSSSSLHRYPTNYGGDFTVELKNSLNFTSNFEVALSEILYRKNWATLQASQNFILLEFAKDFKLYEWLNTYIYEPYKNDELYVNLKDSTKKVLLVLPIATETNSRTFLEALSIATLVCIGGGYARWFMVGKFMSVNIIKHGSVDVLELSPKLKQVVMEDVDIELKIADKFHKWSMSNDIFTMDWRPAPLTESIKIELPTEYYGSSQQVIASLQMALEEKGVKELKIELLASGKARIMELLANGYRISISPILQSVLGFTAATKQYFKEDYSFSNNLQSWTGQKTVEIMRMTESLWIHCDIIKAQNMGDDWSRVLRIIPSIGSPNETTAVTFNNPHYLPLAYNQISNIRIRIFNSQHGVIVPFESDVIIKLHFKEYKL